MAIRGHVQSLSARLTALVLTLLAAFTLVLGFTAYTATHRWLEETALAGLQAIASARQAAVEAQLRGYTDSLAAFIQPDLETTVETLLHARGEDEARRKNELIGNLRREMTAAPSVEWAAIVDLTGAVIASTSDVNAPPQVVTSPAFAQTQIRSQVFDPRAESGDIDIELTHPLRDADNSPIAVLVLHCSARDLLSITGDYTGLGGTGETVLGTRRGDDVYFLAPLRFDPNLSEIEPAPAAGVRAKPMIHATAGQSGIIRALDYRDTRVIAAYRPISPTGWGLVVKQDEAEAFAGVSHLKTALFLGLGLLLLVGTLVTLPVVRSFTRPLRQLQDATGRVADGDLTTTVPSERMDEVGQLADSFNKMVGRLRATHGELERSNRELQSFAYVVSHDLKTPLRGIHSLSEWLEEGLSDALDDEHRKQMELLRARVHRMDALVDGLLEYSRVGRVEEAPTQVDVGQALERVVDSVDPPESMAVTVITPMPTVAADELRISQVFQNLIDNAVKHHPGPEGTIEIGCRETGDFWEFFVKDDGEGIAARHHERIFQIFQTLRSRDDVESTGVGLAIVKKIVERAGGQVRVESDGVVGRGATFFFTWPRAVRE